MTDVFEKLLKNRKVNIRSEEFAPAIENIYWANAMCHRINFSEPDFKILKTLFDELFNGKLPPSSILIPPIHKLSQVLQPMQQVLFLGGSHVLAGHHTLSPLQEVAYISFFSGLMLQRLEDRTFYEHSSKACHILPFLIPVLACHMFA